MATRIQVNLGDKSLALLDSYADAMGVSRSALCSVLIGQGLMNYNPILLSVRPGGGDPANEVEPPEDGEPGEYRSVGEILSDANQRRG